MASLVTVTVEGIARAIEDFVLGDGALSVLVLAGGGALNPVLVQTLRRRLPEELVLTTTDEYGVPSEAREAMAFALLGDAFLRGIPANIPAATGARKAVCLGSYAPGPLIG